MATPAICVNGSSSLSNGHDDQWIHGASFRLRGAFLSGLTASVDWRLRQLDALLRLLVDREDELSRAVSADLGKAPFEVVFSEIMYLRNTCNYFKKNLRKWTSPRRVPTPLVAFPTVAEVIAEPLGVVLIISPWNYPLILALDPLIGAISAGNAVLLKPSEVAPATSKVLARLLPAYLDQRAICVIEGGIRESTLLLEQKWDKIFYTGSAAVGRVVMSAATKNLTPLVLELGGKCPVLVDSTVDLDVTARRLILAKWNGNYGQACIAPDYVLVEASITQALVAKMKKYIVEFYGEDARFSQDHARIVNKNHFNRLKRLLEEDSVLKAIIHGGDYDEDTLYMAPTLLLNPPEQSSVMNEEIFGPILPIVEVGSMDDAINFVKSRPRPIAVYVFTKDKIFERKAASEIQAGSVVFNDLIIQFAFHDLPFGGIGESGTGVYHGKFSFDTFSHPKALVYRKFMLDFQFRYPPFTIFKQRLIRQLFQFNYLGALLVLLGLLRDKVIDEHIETPVLKKGI